MNYKLLTYFFSAGIAINAIIALFMFSEKDILMFIMWFLFLSIVVIDIGLVILFSKLANKCKEATFEQKFLTVGNISALVSGSIFLFFLFILWVR